MARLRSTSGFSLIELMVVVAIIGILAAIAIPNFQKFQAKSRQTEAKGNLGGIYTAEKAFFAEWNNYFADFRDIGFAPEGNLRYNVGFSAAGDPLPVIGYSGPSWTGGAQTAAVAASGNINTTAWCATATNNCTVTAFAQALTAGTISNAVGAQTFTAQANGTVGTTATADTWTIDQKKNLVNTNSGI